MGTGGATGKGTVTLGTRIGSGTGTHVGAVVVMTEMGGVAPAMSIASAGDVVRTGSGAGSGAGSGSGSGSGSVVSGDACGCGAASSWSGAATPTSVTTSASTGSGASTVSTTAAGAGGAGESDSHEAPTPAATTPTTAVPATPAMVATPDTADATLATPDTPAVPAVPDDATAGADAELNSDCGNNESCASHDSGPITRRNRPSDRLMNARTTAGSKWVPAHRASSARASVGVRACLYDRTEVSTSNTSATATMRPACEISVRFRPNGYPVPSHFSWCCTTASTHSPSQSASGSANSAPNSGCCLMTSYSSSVSLLGLFRISVGMRSLPTSWISAAHRSRSMSWGDSPISSPIICAYARTRSEWPRVIRSWRLSAATRSRRCSAAAAVSPRPVRM